MRPVLINKTLKPKTKQKTTTFHIPPKPKTQNKTTTKTPCLRTVI
jgi:hypothetical protein